VKIEREREREREREKGGKREGGTVHADTREITAFAYVWIHRSSERASASGRPGFIGLLQAQRGMAARWREKAGRERESKKEREKGREKERSLSERGEETAGDAAKGEKDRGLR